ncbi:hypothetical protein [Methylorubrum extorquens]|uniref:Uncharacterized protein n=1 Tax=Methylorubrum extorquens TaxID=408 RepID=A0AAX3WBE0_METEX|nr:hypothetical protein [Methylorubrum extorquens]UYW31954.1 hypothetical protein OKB92_23785 [Methylorubrum extorquens]WHQ68657.1 hypothetical protein KEC54_20140 [Methylorubrum extorquens]
MRTFCEFLPYIQHGLADVTRPQEAWDNSRGGSEGHSDLRGGQTLDLFDGWLARVSWWANS